MTVTNYSSVKLTSLTDAHIQEALLDTVESLENNPTYIPPSSIREWLVIVDYESIKHDNEQDGW